MQALHGQLIRIASNSEQHINPMDITIDDYLFTNPMEVIANKSDFLISLCEIIVGGRYGLSSEERSVIDKCVQRIYKKFIENVPTIEKMPLLSDLQRELKNEGEVSLRVANSLEMFVNGSQNIFNNQTNIDMTNRIICFDIKELGNQLKKIGMLIVQDTVWNRVSANREKKKITRYYIDEFHLLLKEEQTAKYSAEIWKRFRKWGGVPTGITQNVKDLLSSQEVENIFDNSDFVYMLNQVFCFLLSHFLIFCFLRAKRIAVLNIFHVHRFITECILPVTYFAVAVNTLSDEITCFFKFFERCGDFRVAVRQNRSQSFDRKIPVIRQREHCQQNTTLSSSKIHIPYHRVMYRCEIL